MEWHALIQYVLDEWRSDPPQLYEVGLAVADLGDKQSVPVLVDDVIGNVTDAVPAILGVGADH